MAVDAPSLRALQLGAASLLCRVTADGERFASQLSQALERQLEEQFYAALRRPDEERAAFSPLQAQI